MVHQLEYCHRNLFIVGWLHLSGIRKKKMKNKIHLKHCQLIVEGGWTKESIKFPQELKLVYAEQDKIANKGKQKVSDQTILIR